MVAFTQICHALNEEICHETDCSFIVYYEVVKLWVYGNISHFWLHFHAFAELAVVDFIQSLKLVAGAENLKNFTFFESREKAENW